MLLGVNLIFILSTLIWTVTAAKYGSTRANHSHSRSRCLINRANRNVWLSQATTWQQVNPTGLHLTWMVKNFNDSKPIQAERLGGWECWTGFLFIPFFFFLTILHDLALGNAQALHSSKLVRHCRSCFKSVSVFTFFFSHVIGLSQVMVK